MRQLFPTFSRTRSDLVLGLLVFALAMLGVGCGSEVVADTSAEGGITDDAPTAVVADADAAAEPEATITSPPIPTAAPGQAATATTAPDGGGTVTPTTPSATATSAVPAPPTAEPAATQTSAPATPTPLPATATPTPPAPTSTAAPTATTTAAPTATPPAPTATPTGTATQPSDCYARLSMAGGWAWICGDVVCDPQVPQAGCPTTAPGPTDACYLGLGPADGPQWVCGGVNCNPPTQPCDGSSPGNSGENGDSNGPTINCVTTPCPQPSFDCSINPLGPVEVNQLLTFTAMIDPPDWDVDISFDHGDGFVDARRVSEAVYLAPGSYTVRMLWQSSGTSGVVTCGVVDVIDPGVSETLCEAHDPAPYLGITADEAASLASANGYAARIVRIDDEQFIVTMDFRCDRINLQIDDGLVTSADIG